MLVKDATLEAGIDKGEPSRLLIEIALRPAFLAGPGPAYDPGEVQRAIRDGFREVLAQVELERPARTTNPPKSRAPRSAVWRPFFCQRPIPRLNTPSDRWRPPVRRRHRSKPPAQVRNRPARSR